MWKHAAVFSQPVAVVTDLCSDWLWRCRTDSESKLDQVLSQSRFWVLGSWAESSSWPSASIDSIKTKPSTWTEHTAWCLHWPVWQSVERQRSKADDISLGNQENGPYLYDFFLPLDVFISVLMRQSLLEQTWEYLRMSVAHCGLFFGSFFYWFLQFLCDLLVYFLCMNCGSASSKGFTEICNFWVPVQYSPLLLFLLFSVLKCHRFLFELGR